MSIPVTNTTQLSAAGNIKASAGYLLWLIVENGHTSGGTATFNNATSGTGSEVFQISVPSLDTVFISFPIAMYFSTGIRCGTLGTSMTVTGGYI